MKIELKRPGHECGPCTLCCKLLEVRELTKPKDAWCPHAKQKCGCSIYATRPESCQTFNCLWLQNMGDEKLRPDRIHGVLTLTADGQNICLHEDPGYRGTARQLLKPMIDDWRKVNARRYVIVLCGDERVFIGTQETFDRLKAEGVVTA